MGVAGEDDRCLARRRPGPTTRGHEQNAALVEEREMGAKSSGVFLWPATGRASSASLLVRCAGWPGVPAPDCSNASSARPSTRARGDSTPGTPTLPPWPCASRSRARWESHRPWPLSATVAAIVGIVGPSACAAGPEPAWRPRQPRRRSPKPVATATPSLPLPALGARLRSSSALARGVPRHGVSAFPRFGGNRRVSCSLRYLLSFTYAKLNNSSTVVICHAGVSMLPLGQAE
jgi:hypothetical protein